MKRPSITFISDMLVQEAIICFLFILLYFNFIVYVNDFHDFQMIF